MLPSISAVLKSTPYLWQIKYHNRLNESGDTCGIFLIALELLQNGLAFCLVDPIKGTLLHLLPFSYLSSVP